MCGRFAFSTPLAVFIDTFEGYDFSELDDAWEMREGDSGAVGGRFNIAPTQDVPVIPNDGSKRVQFFRWGLVPRWAKDPSIGNRMINARAETLAEKPSFRDAFKKRRCVMLADGFYEWRTNPGTKTKTPIHVRLKTGKPFAFAGLWETWMPKGTENKAKGETGTSGETDADSSGSKTTESLEHCGPDHPLRTCTIITTEPNALMSQFHHRMPVILKPELLELWLSSEPIDSGALQPLLIPYPADELVAYPVSTAVNNPRNDTRDLIVQAGPAIEQPGLGF